MSILEVDGLTHSYGDKNVLQNIAFRMLKGEHIGLVGANGAGKSTLFKIITGQLLPDVGKITWHPAAQSGNLEQHIELTAGQCLRAYLQGRFRNCMMPKKKCFRLQNKWQTTRRNSLRDY